MINKHAQPIFTSLTIQIEKILTTDGDTEHHYLYVGYRVPGVSVILCQSVLLVEEIRVPGVSVILCQSVLLVEEIRISGVNHRPVAIDSL
jgi:hypothetical protein